MGSQCGDAMIEHAAGYRLGYLQFNDDGDYAEPGQLERVLADIETASANGLILVAFTHGWKENSGAQRWSVGAFKSMLSEIAGREGRLAAEQSRVARNVAGVFLGWPGRSSALPGFSGLTFFDRGDAAERIARSDDFGDALLRLKAVRDAVPTADGSPGNQPGNQLILVGHSLGATMLYQRLAHEPLRSSGAILSPIADLVLLLSPAIPASDVRTLEQLALADRIVLPPILAITSEDDATLRYAFPLGQWLNGADDGSGGNGLAQLQAMGLHVPLITHRLELSGQGLSLIPTGAKSRHPELLQITVSDAIMTGHKDIANPRLVDFIAGVTALQIDSRFSRAALALAFPDRNP
jgi:pimeloyl-ACP methyl ester carboxylesterase